MKDTEYLKQFLPESLYGSFSLILKDARENPQRYPSLDTSLPGEVLIFALGSAFFRTLCDTYEMVKDQLDLDGEQLKDSLSRHSFDVALNVLEGKYPSWEIAAEDLLFDSIKDQMFSCNAKPDRDDVVQ